ncbi:MAG: phenylalanine--tRNA ligase subunit beta [Gammaproteobacteria bacterium]|nr:MAG: phenylalanine--tRNA ligase subunit beta [Gammaproteobacteria bacterium]
MLVSKGWLTEFVQVDASTEAICTRLTALGLEVDSVDKAAPDFSGVVVGKVIDLQPHPDADRLRLATVDVGDDKALQIVCGAPNVAVGMLVPVAKIGAVLPGNFKIKQSKLRGVESQGMLCSESELGLAEKASGLMSLPSEMTVGQDIREALDLDDEIINIDLTPNRGDCLSMIGVARELAVAFEAPMPLLEDIVAQSSNDAKAGDSDRVSPTVTLSAPDACPHYVARTISGIDNTVQSPLWLVERLRRAGMRSVSAVVDITNYVMLEMGTPMHSFNAAKIDGDIEVRFAKKNEKLILLDGKEAKLDDDMLVIADDKKAIALAGIMGGANSEIDKKSSDIILEAAWFAPSVITGRARRLTLHTDASHRFERGVDYLLQEKAIARASQLIVEICGGQAHRPTVATVKDKLPKRETISLDAKSVNALLGLRLPKQAITGILSRLGMTVAETEKNIYEVLAPSYRFDISIKADLIEELVRVWGYENVPAATVNVNKLKNQAKQDLTPRRRLNGLLVDMGYHEAISYSFIDEKMAGLLSDTDGLIKLMNPLSAELSVMRTSLLPSLTKALLYNVNRQQTNVRLYEFGHGYRQQGKKLLQTAKLAGIATGDVYPMQWGYRNRQIDYFDIKGDVEMIFEQLGVLSDVSYCRSEREFLHPGQSAEILYQGKTIGFIGALHPKVQKILDIDTRVLAFEVDIATITEDSAIVAKTVSKYPEIRRDISVLMAQGHQAADIITAIREISDELVTEVCLFDVYIGRNIPRNTKSMAIAIYLQDKTKTLTDEQADVIIEQITAMLAEKFNAQLRG